MQNFKEPKLCQVLECRSPKRDWLSRIILFIALLIVGVSCGPHSPEDYREEGQEVIQRLIDELSKVESKSDLIDSIPRLKAIFMKLTDIMIAAREYQEKHSDVDPLAFNGKDRELSENLRSELNRIYEMEEGREIIERCQQEALNKLDAFEKILSNKKEKFK